MMSDVQPVERLMLRTVPHHSGGVPAVYILPYRSDVVEVVYTAAPGVAAAWLEKNVIDSNARAVGFDCEWNAQLKKKKDGGVQPKASVLQLAVENSCLVFHFHHMVTRRLPKMLREVLKDNAIKKVGTGVLLDMAKLTRDRGVQCEGEVDIQVMARCLGLGSYDGLGLQELSKRFLGIELKIYKLIEDVSMSNWETFPLSDSQIEYAAMYVWMSVRLFNCMTKLAGDGGISVQAQQVKVEVVEVAGQSDPPTTSKKAKDGPMCGKCGKTFVNKQALVNHMQTKGRKRGKYCIPTEANSKLVIYCEGCGKKCKDEGSLAKHQVKAAHVRCQSCGKFFHKVVPKKHRNSCGKVICETCGKQFERKADLAPHIVKAKHVRCQGCLNMFCQKIPKKHTSICARWLVVSLVREDLRQSSDEVEFARKNKKQKTSH